MIALLELLTDHVGRLVQLLEDAPLRGLGPEDLLTELEVARYVRIKNSEVRTWLTGRKVPRALSPGKARIPLYRVKDVRLALEEDHSRAEQDQARKRLA